MKVVEGKNVYSISEVNAIAKESLEYLSFWVDGELASFQTNTNWYNSFFVLKDETSSLPCYFDPRTVPVDKDLIDKKVLIFGRLTLFRNNEYKMRVFSIESAGDGILAKQFQELYKKLKTEGLFEDKYKKEIPKFPRKVCIVTSEGSAGWKDFRTHSQDKFPVIELSTADVRVEGNRALSQLLKVLPEVDSQNFDCIVITRGGGAEETLVQVFNDEKLARAIFALKTPVIVAIGHEVNVTLAELVADRRASTPTDAANIITENYRILLEKLEYINYKLESKLDYLFSTNSQKLDSIYKGLSQAKASFKELPFRLETSLRNIRVQMSRLFSQSGSQAENLFQTLSRQSKIMTVAWENNLRSIEKSLILLSPSNTLARGYSITYNEKGRVVKSIDQIVVGETIGVKFADGGIRSKVILKKRKNEKEFERA